MTEHKGSAMSQWVLTKTGNVLPIQTLRSLTPAELNQPVLKEKMRSFNEFMALKKFGGSMGPAKPESDPTDPLSEYQHCEDNDGEISNLPEADDIMDYDLYINSEVLLPHNGEHIQAARVMGRSKDANGGVTGSHHLNPMLDKRVYDVIFPDGAVQQYAANLITENTYSQVDTDEHRYQSLDCIADHRTDGRALKGKDRWTISKNSKKMRRMTAQGWYFLIRWKDSMESWVPLKELKESHLI